MINRFERFIFSITEIDRYWHKIAADEMKKYDMKGPYAIYLIVMHKHADGVTASQLCEICGRNKADVSRAVADMESRGFVKRVSTGTNTYKAKLVLTDEGNAAAECVCGLAAKAIEKGGKGLTDKKREMFYETLELIAGNLKMISEKGLEE